MVRAVMFCCCFEWINSVNQRFKGNLEPVARLGSALGLGMFVIGEGIAECFIVCQRLSIEARWFCIR
ncbi:hypothetical protein VCR17J2_340091 [Vibrio coralliirubri]|nr:hypothetical protein VCR17J2_340091 [Vibrio coralliirubri]